MVIASRAPSSLSTWAGRFGLLVLGLVLAAGAAEVWARLDPRSLRRFNSRLHFNSADVEVHQAVPGPLLYRLSPGARLERFEGDGRSYQVEITAEGARAPGDAQHHEPEALRILFFGASTVYGPGLASNETIPARLEAALEAEGRSASVENFGTSAYVTAQMALLAVEKLQQQDADLVLVLLTNRGPRPFLAAGSYLDRDHSPWFRRDPSLFLEVFPASTDPERPWLLWVLGRSALLRYAFAGRVDPPQVPDWPATVAQRENERLEQLCAARGIDLVYLLHPVQRAAGSPPPPEGHPDIPDQVPLERVVRLAPWFTRGVIWMHHPKAAGADRYAQAVARALEAGGWLDR